MEKINKLPKTLFYTSTLSLHSSNLHFTLYAAVTLTKSRVVETFQNLVSLTTLLYGRGYIKQAAAAHFSSKK